MSREVLVILHEDALGGATRAITRVVPEMAERGWSFSFWVGDPSPAADEVRALGQRVIRAPRVEGIWPNPLVYSARALRLDPGVREHLRKAGRAVRALRRVIRTRRPALVHANTILSSWEGMIARRAGSPVLLHVHEPPFSGWKSHLAGRLVASADVVVAPSQAIAAELRSSGVSAAVAHYGIDAGAEPRRAEEGSVVGTLGTISRRKGSDTFVEAAIEAGRIDSGIRFEMGGAADAPFERAWAEGVLARAQAAGVEWSPHLDAGDAFSRWSVFALPSRADPFPNVVLEAMAAGTPIVAAAVDGIPEQLAGDAGVLVAPGDPVALAHAVAALLADPARRERLAANARARVLSEFTLARQADALEAAYLRAAGRA